MKDDKFYQKCLVLLKNQKQVFLTKAMLHQMKNMSPSDKALRAIFDGIDDDVTSQNYIVTASGLSRVIKLTVNTNRSLIRHINSDTATDKVDYADLQKVPGSDNYRQVFHYKHKLTPDQKHYIKMAKKTIYMCLVLGMSHPDTSPTAPIYDLRYMSKPWTYHLVFKDRVIQRLKKLRLVDTPWKRFVAHWKAGKNYRYIYED